MAPHAAVQVNERYLPQLSSILSFPQSVGIVGGRPGASLYFVGVQGGAVLYLDPHEVQQVRAGHWHCGCQLCAALEFASVFQV